MILSASPPLLWAKPLHRKDCTAKLSDFSNTVRKSWRKSPFIGTLNKFSLVIEGGESDEEPEAESSDDEDETNTEFITLLAAVKNSGIFSLFRQQFYKICQSSTGRRTYHIKGQFRYCSVL